MKHIELTQGHIAFIDDEDFEQVSRYRWHVAIRGPLIYASRGLVIEGRRTTQYLHQFLLGAKEGHVIDHCDGNGLNNCRSNLRFATTKQNVRSRHRTSGSSGAVGVCLEKSRTRKPWRAYIYVDRRAKHLGYFQTRELAIKARHIAAREFHGDFASCA